mgnify:CR=1 FL=1
MNEQQKAFESVLTIGGSDSSGGAGIQADLKTFNRLGVHGASVITCVTAQNSQGVSHVEAISCDLIRHQIDAVLSDLSVQALKTGMLFSADIADVIAYYLADFSGYKIIDPVMVSRVGSKLLSDDAIACYKKSLFPLASLITPNIYEASLLTDYSISTQADVEKAATRFLDYGAEAVLVKGGGLQRLAGQDYFLTNQGVGTWHVSQFVSTPHTHGTGCTLSAAITALLACGSTWSEAILKSKLYVSQALLHAAPFGRGTGCLCHFSPNY